MEDNKPIYILSCSGGGIRGTIIAQFLFYLEQTMQKPISEIFDVFAGTSTGGLIALAFGVVGLTSDRINQLYSEENSQSIMNKSFWDKLLGIIQARPKYDGENKEVLLRALSGRNKFKTESEDKLTLITAYNITKREATVFSTMHPDHQKIDAWKIGDATSAAPIYFPPIEINKDYYIDGGVVANDPTMVAIAYVKELQQTGKWNPNRPLVVISIGTGHNRKSINGKKAEHYGPLGWLKDGKLIQICMDQTMIPNLTQWILDEDKDKYLRINGNLEAQCSSKLDDTSHENIEALKGMGKSWWEIYGSKVIELLS